MAGNSPLNDSRVRSSRNAADRQSPPSRSVQVALPVPLPGLFDYGLPDTLPTPAVGVRVRVDFGHRQLVGVVADSGADPGGRALKPVIDVLDPATLFDTELWASLQWAAGYYHHPLGEVLNAALPARLRQGAALPDSDEPALRLTAAGREVLDQARLRPGPGRELLQALAEGPLPLTDLFGAGDPRLRAAAARLRRRDWIASCRLPWTAAPRSRVSGPPANADQSVAIERLSALVDAGGYHGVLLEGVTGSGKTEVYLRAIEQALDRGRQVLVLVPEIALTPQALSRYRERLGNGVSALHSGLSDGERAQVWARMHRGEPGVVIGTRSAVFTPLPKAGLIVVDEEHDGSYKQADGFRYHARDLALVRGKALAVPVLLGSATPSLESLALVQEGRLEHLALGRRAVALARPPELRLLDLRNQPLQAGLSKTALQALTTTLARGEQALVFRNRRGYAPVLTCSSCGWHALCPRCDRAMTVHRKPPALICHHCGHRQRTPTQCPHCASGDLGARGVGTERLQSELAERFAPFPVLRIDRDQVRSHAQLDAMLAQVADGEPAILVGTQLLAKGHDWPNLTLVIVVDADSGLFSADFRAPERLAQQLTQVAGRAGRGERPGLVLVQTRQPQHPFWLRWLADGYAGVASAELAERRAAALPPFRQQALLAAEAQDSAALDAFFAALPTITTHAEATVDWLGPLPAPMPRRAGFHRAQVLIESDSRPPLHACLRDLVAVIHTLPQARKVRWSLDVDPYDLY